MGRGANEMNENKSNLIGPGGEVIYYKEEKKPFNDMDIIKLHGLTLRRTSKINTSSRKTKRREDRLQKRLLKRQRKKEENERKTPNDGTSETS